MKIAIVGAGLMGRLLALFLLRGEQKIASQYSSKITKKLDITLFDKDTKSA